MVEMAAQYERIRGELYVSPRTQPVYLGEVPREVFRFVQSSAESLLAEGEEVATLQPLYPALSAQA